MKLSTLLKSMINYDPIEKTRVPSKESLDETFQHDPNDCGCAPARYLSLDFESEASMFVSDWMNLSRHEHHPLQDIGECKEQNTSEGDERKVLVYLIRHGEAEHNILEKRAMKAAQQSSLEEDGLPEDHPETQRRVDEARQSVLNDESLRDARLSDVGRREAEKARDLLQKIIREGDGDSVRHRTTGREKLSAPSYILVSPLTRTLETADILFPGHCEIHVREDLEERRTGKPPDMRSSVAALGKRNSFQRFSMNRLWRQSMLKLCLNELIQTHTGERPSTPLKEKNSASTDGSDTSSTRQEQDPEVLVMRGDLCQQTMRSDYHFSEEDKEELRKRTERLFVLLGETDQNTVAVVTHKGYLRELERGPLGQTDAVEFKNCEIRAYEVMVSLADDRLVRAERVR